MAYCGFIGIGVCLVYVFPKKNKWLNINQFFILLLNNKFMLEPSLIKNDTRAKWLIGIFSFVVFAVVVSLGKIKLTVDLGFNNAYTSKFCFACKQMM